MAQAKNNGRKAGGMSKVRKQRTAPVLPDGAHGMNAGFLASKAEATADALHAERRTEDAAAAASEAEKQRFAKAAQQAEAEALRLETLAPRPCRRCKTLFPPDSFERTTRAKTGRLPFCRPCADIVRTRKQVSAARLAEKKRGGEFAPKSCKHCGGQFSPPRWNVVYCNDDCRQAGQRAAAQERKRQTYAALTPEEWAKRRTRAKQWKRDNPDRCREHRRDAYHAHKEAEDAAHTAWVAANRARVNAYQRELPRRRQAIQEGKTALVGAGVFLLVRAASGFFRAAPVGEPIGRTEQILAYFELLGLEEGHWTVRPPFGAGREQQRLAARLTWLERSRLQAQRYYSLAPGNVPAIQEGI